MCYHSAIYIEGFAYAVLNLITGDIMFYYIQHTATTIYLIRNFNLIPYYACSC